MKVKSIKKTLAVMVSMAMMLSMAGCGNSSEPQQTSEPVAEEPAAEEPAAEEAEPAEDAAEAEDTAAEDTASTGLSGSFSIFHFHEDEGAGTSKAFWSAANKFMEENPDVNIEFIFTDSDN